MEIILRLTETNNKEQEQEIQANERSDIQPITKQEITQVTDRTKDREAVEQTFNYNRDAKMYGRRNKVTVQGPVK